MENSLKACENYCKTRKVTGFKSLQLKYWEINRQHQNAKLIFGQNLQKRSKDMFKKHRHDCEHSYSQLLFCH